MKLRRDIKVEDWIEVRYNGQLYTVAVKSMLSAWMHEQSVREMHKCQNAR